MKKACDTCIYQQVVPAILSGKINKCWFLSSHICGGDNYDMWEPKEELHMNSCGNCKYGACISSCNGHDWEPIEEEDYSMRDEVEVKHPQHYSVEYRGIKIDLYRIFTLFNITCPAIQHAIKKLIRCGASIKSTKVDIQEAIDILNRKLEMLSEDEQGEENG